MACIDGDDDVTPTIRLRHYRWPRHRCTTVEIDHQAVTIRCYGIEREALRVQALVDVEHDPVMVVARSSTQVSEVIATDCYHSWIEIGVSARVLQIDNDPVRIFQNKNFVFDGG